MSESISSSRRRFLQASVATAASVMLPRWTLANGAPAIVVSDNERPKALQWLRRRVEPQRPRSSHAGRVVVR